MWFALVIPAVAAPTFLGLPDDVALATAAWEGARACTGREGLAAPEVAIVRRVVPGDYLGVARTDPVTGHLYRIELNASPGRHREVLVHEVAHAWVSEGPVALVEGTAELIADCVVANNPGLAPLQFDDGRDIGALPDLLAWNKPTEDAPFELHAVRTDAYVGAARLLRTASLLVPSEALWSSRTLDWNRFEAQLLAAGDRGNALWTALKGGAVSQRQALTDADQDGLVAIAETWARTDDTRYDTDADGWWDGAPRGHAAIVIPLDGTPVCTCQGAGHVGGNLRGAAADVQVAPLPWGTAATVMLSDLPTAETTGGLAWLGAVPAAGCQSTQRVTVFAVDPALQGLVAPMVHAIEVQLILAEGRFGSGPQRVAVAIGGAHSTVNGEIVHLAAADLTGPVEAAAALAVALRRLWVAGDRDWPAAVALSRAITAR